MDVDSAKEEEEVDEGGKKKLNQLNVRTEWIIYRHWLSHISVSK